MFSLGNHDKEHERLIRLNRITPVVVTALPAASSANSGQRVNYLNLDWYSDGTRWLSVQRFVQSFVPRDTQPFTAATHSMELTMPDYNLAGGTYLEKIVCEVFFNTVQSGVNFYTFAAFNINGVTGGAGALTLSGGTTDTKTFTTATRWYVFNPGLTPVAQANTISGVDIQMTPSGAPGTFLWNAALTYRLIGA